MDILKVEDLHIKLTKEFYTLFNIGFSLKKGEKMLIIAEENSGKTMLLRAICGLEEADKGNVYVEGRDVKTVLKEDQTQIGFLPTYPIFLDTKTVKQNLEYVLKNRKVDKTLIATKISDVVERFNLKEIENKSVYTLSYFEKLIVAISRLALRDLDILLIDTFNSNLDESQVKIIEDFLEKEFYENTKLTLIKASTTPYVGAVKFKVMRMNNGSLSC